MEINVSAAVIKKHEYFFIAKRKLNKIDGGKWEFPGGKIEKGETAIDCLKRELKEELNIEIENASFYSETTTVIKDRTIIIKAFKVKMLDGHISLNAHDEYKWILKEEFMNYIFCLPDIQIIQKILNEAS